MYLKELYSFTGYIYGYLGLIANDKNLLFNNLEN